MTEKTKIATVWLDGCSGCHMSFLDIDEHLIELGELADLVEDLLVAARSVGKLPFFALMPKKGFSQRTAVLWRCRSVEVQPGQRKRVSCSKAIVSPSTGYQ